MSVIDITKENFEEIVLKSEKPVLVDFYATWCGPCAMIAPFIEEIAEENDDVVVGHIDVDKEPELAGTFGVMSIPTLIVFKNGEITNKAIGARGKEAILDLFD